MAVLFCAGYAHRLVKSKYFFRLHALQEFPVYMDAVTCAYLLAGSAGDSIYQNPALFDQLVRLPAGADAALGQIFI